MTGWSVGAGSDGMQTGINRFVSLFAADTAIAWFFPAAHPHRRGDGARAPRQARPRQLGGDRGAAPRRGHRPALSRSPSRPATARRSPSPSCASRCPTAARRDAVDVGHEPAARPKPGAQVTVLYDPADPTRLGRRRRHRLPRQLGRRRARRAARVRGARRRRVPGNGPVSAEPYVVRRLGLAQLIPIVVSRPGWRSWRSSASTSRPRSSRSPRLHPRQHRAQPRRLRIDEKGVRMRPASRIPWEHIQAGRDRARRARPRASASSRAPRFPRGIRGMIDGELTLPRAACELDPRARNSTKPSAPTPTPAAPSRGCRAAARPPRACRPAAPGADRAPPATGRRPPAGLRDLRIFRRDVGAHARSPTRRTSGAPHGAQHVGQHDGAVLPLAVLEQRDHVPADVTAVPLSVATWRGPPPAGR